MKLCTTSIENQYNNFDKLTNMFDQNWEFIHLLALPDRYDNVVSLIKQAIGTLTDEKRAEYLVRERIVALMIFQIYERSIYQWQNSKEISDSQRFKFLADTHATQRTTFLYDVLMYFTQRLLRNPRLLYYWSEESFHDYFEDFTKKHYSKYITDNSDNLNIKLDSSGPFGKNNALK
ncbi:hypothetical protein GMMP15_1590031 [Candidatus Magnetomoraceae bacterium gMMP-15]